MLISKNTAVEFHYTLSSDGTQVESSLNEKPMDYLHGHGGIFPTLEEALEGKTTGDTLEVTLTPEQSYGERREEGHIQRIPIKHLQTNGKPKVGSTALVESNQGRQQVTIVKVGKFNADCDLNHPFAGKTLTFAIEIMSVRAATEEEISHGHIHAEGGCGH